MQGSSYSFAPTVCLVLFPMPSMLVSATASVSASRWASGWEVWEGVVWVGFQKIAVDLGEDEMGCVWDTVSPEVVLLGTGTYWESVCPFHSLPRHREVGINSSSSGKDEPLSWAPGTPDWMQLGGPSTASWTPSPHSGPRDCFLQQALSSALHHHALRGPGGEVALRHSGTP